MQWTQARKRFAFLASAFEGDGGFAPTVAWRERQVTNAQTNQTSTVIEPSLTGPTELVRYMRESDAKFGARNAVAVYNNHLRAACERFVGFLGRRRPQRDGADAPLIKLAVEDADRRGTHIDRFWTSVALHLKARGSMLIVIDKPEGAPANLADQQRRRAVPYIRTANPEDVIEYVIDPYSGLFISIKLAAVELIGNELVSVEREYTQTAWTIRQSDGGALISSGTHAFGQCPVIAITETGGVFPVFGKFAQIADLSRRIFNASSELDEILRSQTFSLLTMQVKPEEQASFDPAVVSATVGTHSMLVHGGDTPAYISPDSGPAEVYMKRIESLEQSIRRISMEDATEQGAQAESGVARKLRFEALNADLATFATSLQQAERQVWVMFNRALMTSTTVNVTWPSDFNLADVIAELDILTLMQSAGFPPDVLAEKRRTIVAVEFDASSEATKAMLAASIDQVAQQSAQQPGA